MIFIGIDTSCYTTSIAAVNEKGEIVSNKRKLLSVADGDRGLRQSEAFFKHINNFPQLYSELLDEINISDAVAICVSAQPRSAGNSYMPVFYAGMRMAEIISSTANIKLYKTDHQQAHVAAAMYSCPLKAQEFIAVHLSGGTTEVLSVQKLKHEYKIKALAGSTDINAGQLLDRLGVAMGLPFPAGKYIDENAMKYTGERIVLPINASIESCSFSGTEAAALRELESGCDKEALCEALMSAVSRSIAKMMGSAAYYAGISDVVMAGGVSSSDYLRTALPLLLEKRGFKINLYFAQKELSSDNAVGVARLCMMKHSN